MIDRDVNKEVSAHTASQRAHRGLVSAWMPVVEHLEGRRFFSTTTIQTLPFTLDFSADRGELLDKDGQGTGFTRVQTNKLGTEYQSGLIDLDTTAGILKLTTTGTSTAGSNSAGDNTLVNSLETQFNATTSGFSITARLIGPLDFLNNPSEQGGIMFGPDQDNWVKLVAVSQPAGQRIQFIDEQTTGTTYSSALGATVANTYTNVGSFAAINTLDLRLVGDAATGKVQAYYAINGASFVKIAAELTLTGAKKDAFFNAAGRAGLIALHKNDVGPITVTFDKFEILGGTSTAARPNVTATRPANGATGVSRDSFIAADVHLTTAGAGIDAATLTSSTVKLYRTSDGALVNAVLNTSGGGDAIVLTPTDLLAANTQYTFEVTTGLKDTSGNAFLPFSMSFTTGATGGETDPSIAFEKVSLSNATGHMYSSVKIGPDGKLYATTIEGLIQRFTLNSNGTLGAVQNITSLQTLEGGQTFLTGIAFDPASTSTNVIVWATHSVYAFENATDWTGKISRISGVNLETAVNKVVGLPRSIRDHVTNQLVFGPDGAIYFAQGSMSAMGAPDTGWGMRSEHLLSGAILRLDTTKLPATGALNVKTEDGGTYNPNTTGAALTLYATGVRNAYDLVWASNGKLYAATNGSAAGGNTPAGGGAPALTNVQQTQNDYLFLIEQGGYYGHPNPLRGEYVLNGGNPTSGVDPGEVTAYPVGTMPDSNWRGFAYDFGKNWSPNGTIQYSGSAFGGSLNGRLIVARYSGGDDLLVLQLGADGKVTNTISGIAGFTHYIDPLDVAQNPATGHLYVAEFGGERLTLVRAIAPGANITVDKPALYFNDTVATGSSPTQTITIKNTGTSALAFPADGISITGADSARFAIVTAPGMPFTIAPGASVTVSVRFTSSTAVRIYTAKLVLKSNDPDSPTVEVDLRGLGTAGTGGQNEPSLQRILDLFQIPINAGDANPDNTNLYSNLEPLGANDEITVQRLIKAGAGPVTIQPIAMMGVSGTPAVKFGYYRPGTPGAKTELFTIGTADAQSVNPTAIGTTSFDPGSAAFGVYSIWPWTTFKNPDNSVRETFSEDSLNTYESTTSNRRKIRFYALRNADGSVVPNAYVMAHEEFINDANGAYDNQDIVAIIRNVQIAPAAPVVGLENRDGNGALFPDRLVFNRIDIPDSTVANVVHDVATLRINNTGNQALNISGMSLTGPFAFVNSYTYPLSIAAGSFLDVKVRFTQTSSGMGTAVNGIRNGTLTINSNDPSRPTSTVQLSGHWQLQSERTPSPGSKVTEMTLADIFNVYGYTTSVPTQSVLTSTGNGAARLNDEVLSGYWMRAEASMPVKITQLVAFHTQGNTERIATHLQGSTTTTTNVFVHAGADGQSFLPHLNGSATAPAAGTVSTAHMAGVFGFRVGNQWSDDSLNPQNTPGGGGRFLRIFVAKDRNGNVIPNTYLIAHDYHSTDPTTGANTSNFDFQDNIYLVENVRPANDATAPAAPTGLGATGGTGGNNLDWANNVESDLAGYNVYRSDSATGTFTKLNTSLLTASAYLDTTAPSGATSYYRVTAVDASGNESAAATISAARPAGDITAPAAPTGLDFTASLGGIALNWNDNVESDLAGYNVYRSSTSGGTYTKLNTAGLLTSSAYNDTTAPSGATSYYRVTAVDSSGNESLAATGNAARPAADTTAPAAPAGQSATAGPSGITIDWVDNIESDLAGYNVYRGTSASGTFTKLNTSGLLTASSYLDTTAPTGTSYYRITAVDSSNNESATAATSATRTALYSGTDVNGSTPAGSHVTIVDGRDYDVTGGGININDTADQFYYLYRQLSGDFDMRVRLDGLTRVGDFTKAGLMARESLAANSRNAITYGTPDTYGDRFSYRAETGGTTGISVGDSAPATYPNNWLRLKRVGSTFSGYKSTDGVNWTQIGPSQVINMPGTVFFGMAVSARSTTKLATANFRQLGSLLVDAPPAAPSGLGATGSTSGIALNWNDNTETDLAGYNVYRSSTSGGTYTKLNTSGLLTSSAYNDTAAPSGATSYYRVTAVDDAGTESPVASTNAVRPAPSDITPPAAPTGVTTTPSTASIVLDWANNTETDLAGYNVYRSSTSGGTYTKLNPGAPGLTASAYTDTTATAGAVSYYRITAVDTSGNESAPLSTSATRPAPAVTPSGPLRINFQANGTPSVSGYAQDNGDTFATRANGWQYGWNIDHASEDRDRNINSNQLLDTLVQMKSASNWQVAVANGTYDVKVSVGDARYATNHTINVNGTNLWTNAATAANAFLNKTVRITVTNGRIKIDNGASANTATRINYVEIIPVTLVNFQLNGSPAVAGYAQDNGDVFGTRSNGAQYGWSVSHTDQDRDRNVNANQLLDTLVQMRAGSNWQIAVANGKYEVKVSVGDSRYATSHTVNVNGVNYWTNAATAVNAFLTKTVTITVTNGRIKLDNGTSADFATRINYIELRQIA